MATPKDKKITDRISANILYLRTIEGATMEQLAETLGCEKADIANWEKSRSTPKMPDLIRIADHFKVTLDDIVRKDLSKSPLSLKVNRAITDKWQVKYYELLDKYTKVLEGNK